MRTTAEAAGRFYNIPMMKSSVVITLLAACAFAQETPTEREAARVVLQKMDALEKSLEVPGWVAKLSAPDAARDAVTARARQLMDTELLAMGDDITRHPEIGFQETRSVGILVDYLKAHKFDVTVGVAKLSTAFVARYQGNRGAPNLGVIVEYDALRGTKGAFHGDQHSTQGPIGLAVAVAGMPVPDSKTATAEFMLAFIWVHCLSLDRYGDPQHGNEKSRRGGTP